MAKLKEPGIELDWLDKIKMPEMLKNVTSTKAKSQRGKWKVRMIEKISIMF